MKQPSRKQIQTLEILTGSCTTGGSVKEMNQFVAELDTVDGRNPIPNHLACMKIPVKNGISTTNLPKLVSWTRISGYHQQYGGSQTNNHHLWLDLSAETNEACKIMKEQHRVLRCPRKLGSRLSKWVI